MSETVQEKRREKSVPQKHAEALVPTPEKKRARSPGSVSGITTSGPGSGVTDPTSADLLADMAKPKVFEGPGGEVVKTISDELEKSIAQLDEEERHQARIARRVAEKNRYQAEYYDAQRAIAAEKDPVRKEALKVQATQRRAHAQAELPLETYAVKDALYIGSVVLTDIPPTKEGEAALLESAELVFEPDYALTKAGSAVEVPRHAKVERQIVRLVLQTMIDAGQIEYLRRSGIVGADWKVIVEVHYYRGRSKTAANLHKDTLGHTLFVNLNYTNEARLPGPEWIVNPPLVPTHEEHIEEQLPARFMADLEQTRGTPSTMIDTVPEGLPPYGVVSFVDEAIHHATPLLGHRQVSVKKLREWLQADAEFRKEYGPAKKAFDDAKPYTGMWSYISSPPSFEAGFKGATDKETRLWKALMTLCARDDDVMLQRPDLLAADMAEGQIDRLLSEVGPNTFNAVSIPDRARKDKKPDREPMIAPGQQKPIILKRRVSRLLVKGTMPQDPGGDRRFFRTWVRAVRK